MEQVLVRAGLWFGALILAVVACAMALDRGYAIHMAICALAAGLALWFTISGKSVDAAVRGMLRMPDQGRYDDDPIRWAVIATVFWGIAGFSAGLWIALELPWPQLNFGREWLNFGRLRPLHTSAVIFAFGGNALIGTSLYVVQRTCRARLAFPGLARFVFWGYQLFIVLAATGYLLGITQGKEYAEPVW